MERRLSVAADVLLEQRSIPVADVARLVGYRQGSHFARAFRRRYGVSPAEFRERAVVEADQPGASVTPTLESLGSLVPGFAR